MDIYIFLTVNIIWFTLTVLYHLQREFIWKQIQELGLRAIPLVLGNPAIPFVVNFIQRKTPQMTRKRKFIEFRYVTGGQCFVVPIPLNGEHQEPHSYLLMKKGEEIGRLVLPSKVPLLVSAADLGCDEIKSA